MSHDCVSSTLSPSSIDEEDALVHRVFSHYSQLHDDAKELLREDALDICRRDSRLGSRAIVSINHFVSPSKRKECAHVHNLLSDREVAYLISVSIDIQFTLLENEQNEAQNHQDQN